jgi:toxin ParE1/3/4
MKVRWTPEAKRDRFNILDYIAEDSSRAADQMDELFGAAAIRLANHAHLGRMGKVPGTRELIVHENYRLVYEIEGDVVWLLALVHTSRRWPILGA